MKLSDNEFIDQFSNCRLNPEIFNHEAHLRLAYIHLKNDGLQKSMETISNQLRQFTKYHGAEDKYNATLTIAAIKAVHHFMKKSDSQNFIDFIVEFPRLKYNFRDLMNAHYGFDIFKSKQAKRRFLEPDLLPFD